MRARRQRDDHREAAARGLLRGEGAAHRLGQPARQRQPEADAGGVVGVAEPLERGEDPFQVGRRDARPAVDDPELDPVAEPAAGDERRACPAGSSAARWPPGWRRTRSSSPGSARTSGRSSGTSTTTAAPGRPQVVQAPGARRRRGRPARLSTDRRRPAAGSCPAGCRPAGPAGRATRRRSASSSSRSCGVQLDVGAAQAGDRRLGRRPAGVRRSWPTAASSAVRIRSASASGSAAAAASAEPVPVEDDGRLGGERPDDALVLGRQRAARAGRARGVSPAGTSVSASSGRRTARCRHWPRPSTRRPGRGGRAVVARRPSSLQQGDRRQPERLADPLQQRGQRRLAAQHAAGQRAQGLGLRGRPGPPAGCAGRPGRRRS